MEDNLLISVLNPICICRMLQGICDQKNSDCEIICMDDGSKDGSYVKILEFRQLYPEMSYSVLQQKTRGRSLFGKPVAKGLCFL